MTDLSNTDVVRSAVEAYNRRDTEAFCSRAHAEIDLRPPVSSLQGRAYHGHEGVREWLRDVDESFDHAQIEAGDLSEVDSRILMLGKFLVRGRESQMELVSELGIVCEVYRGAILSWHGFFNHNDAIRAAEMAEC